MKFVTCLPDPMPAALIKTYLPTLDPVLTSSVIN
uniref:Uncharacterized protein n=1 Tax=Anguilla anguilla TaxID=7936 RepID=A0A0E9QE68_ANGAN